MASRGQMALDLLLGLLVLLIVLNAFSLVLNRFEETQKEVSIRQQLRENVLLAQLLITYSSGHTHEIYTYPATGGASPTAQGTALPYKVNTFVHAPGEISLSTVRAINYPTGVSCSSSFDIPYLDTMVLSASVLGADVGLSDDILLDQNIIVRYNLYDTNHALLFDTCYGKMRIEAIP